MTVQPFLHIVYSWSTYENIPLRFLLADCCIRSILKAVQLIPSNGNGAISRFLVSSFSIATVFWVSSFTVVTGDGDGGGGGGGS